MHKTITKWGFSSIIDAYMQIFDVNISEKIIQIHQLQMEGIKLSSGVMIQMIM